MRQNPQDAVLDKALERKQKFSDYIAKHYKVKPFATEEIPPAARIWAVDNLGYEDFPELVQEYGMETVAYVLAQTEKLRQDGRRKR